MDPLLSKSFSRAVENKKHHTLCNGIINVVLFAGIPSLIFVEVHEVEGCGIAILEC
jgi:hypothetical protein